MGYTVVSYRKTHTQIFRTEHAVQVGNGSKLLGGQSAIEGIQSFYSTIFVLQVGSHKAHVRCKVFEEWACKGSAQHRDANVGILVRQRPYHWYHHRHIAHG